MKSFQRATIVLLLLTLSWGCIRRSEVSETVTRVKRRPNILLISIDALGARHLGCYGAERNTSPFLDELARDGVLFQNAFVNTHGTPPSHTTMLSGLYQETHRVAWEDAGRFDVIPEGVPLLPELLQLKGYRTIGVTDGGYVSRQLGFARGFDEFDDDGGGIRSGMEKVVASVERLHDGSGPLFVFLHTYEVHSPYDPPEEYATMFGEFSSDFRPTSENLLEHVHSALDTLTVNDRAKILAFYQAEIRYTDDVLREFFERIRDLGFLADAIVIITSDHGEEFGEHGGLLHKSHVYEELIRVPLIISAPFLPSGVIEESMSSIVQITPSVLQWIGESRPEIMEGEPLRIEAAPAEEDAVFGQYSSALYFIRTPRWKLIENSAPFKLELYDLDADPGELENVADANPDLTRKLFHRIRRWKAERRPVVDRPHGVELTPEEIKQLEALGYLR